MKIYKKKHIGNIGNSHSKVGLTWSPYFSPSFICNCTKLSFDYYKKVYCNQNERAKKKMYLNRYACAQVALPFYFRNYFPKRFKVNSSKKNKKKHTKEITILVIL